MPLLDLDAGSSTRDDGWTETRWSTSSRQARGSTPCSRRAALVRAAVGIRAPLLESKNGLPDPSGQVPSPCGGLPPPID